MHPQSKAFFEDPAVLVMQDQQDRLFQEHGCDGCEFQRESGAGCAFNITPGPDWYYCNSFLLRQQRRKLSAT